MSAGEFMVRVPLVLVSVLVIGTRGASADADLDLPAELARTVQAKLDALSAANIPTDRVRQKLREGRAKKVPAVRLTDVVVRLADSLLWAAGQLEGCAPSDRSVHDRLVELAAELLFDSVPQAELAIALRQLCDDEAAAAKLTRASGLYSFLNHKLAASPPAAWQLAFEILRRGEDEGAVNRLVPVLQEVYRSKRSVDRPLSIAVTRLRAGASMRTVRNELRDQFLRR